MTASLIESLTLTNFRGSTQPLALRFARNKNVAIILGGNGTGKSTIVDAIDFICNQEFGSLADRSGASAAKHLVSVNAAPAQVEVKLVTDGGAWRAGLRGSKIAVTPENPPRALVLRRADITRLMDAAPADRYKALQAFITVPHVEAAEESLRKAVKDVGMEVSLAESQKQQAVQALAALWQAEAAPLGNADAWARAKTREGAAALQARLDANKLLRDHLRDTERLRSDARANAEARKSLGNNLQQIALSLAEAQQGGVAGDAQLVPLLEEAQRYLQSDAHAAGICPVCGKAEADATLLQRIDAALERTAAVRALLAQQAETQLQLNNYEAVQAAAKDAYIAGCRQLAAAMIDAPPAFRGNADVAALEFARTDNPALLAAKALLDDLDKRAPLLDAIIEDDQKTLNQLTSLRTHLHTIEQANAVLHAQQAVAERLRGFLAVAEGARKRYVEKLLHTIADQVDAFYAALHPDEALGSVAVTVKSTGKASLELKARFGEVQDVAPTAYYSEGHLDTLGLCIYLAMAQNAGTSASIVVLDDVLGSLDEAHLQRVVHLLAEQAPAIGHLIITTPSQAWFDAVRAGGSLDADLIELGAWSLEEGIQVLYSNG